MQATIRLKPDKDPLQRQAVSKLADNKQLRINYALLNGQVSAKVINPRTGRMNRTPLAFYDGSADEPYQITVNSSSPTSLFCTCPGSMYHSQRNCKHIKLVKEHVPEATIQKLILMQEA